MPIDEGTERETQPKLISHPPLAFDLPQVPLHLDSSTALGNTSSVSPPSGTSIENHMPSMSTGDYCPLSPQVVPLISLSSLDNGGTWRHQACLRPAMSDSRLDGGRIPYPQPGALIYLQSIRLYYMRHLATCPRRDRCPKPWTLSRIRRCLFLMLMMPPPDSVPVRCSRNGRLFQRCLLPTK